MIHLPFPLPAMSSVLRETDGQVFIDSLVKRAWSLVEMWAVWGFNEKETWMIISHPYSTPKMLLCQYRLLATLIHITWSKFYWQDRVSWGDLLECECASGKMTPWHHANALFLCMVSLINVSIHSLARVDALTTLSVGASVSLVSKGYCHFSANYILFTCISINIVIDIYLVIIKSILFYIFCFYIIQLLKNVAIENS